jgi:hypothetical protein
MRTRPIMRFGWRAGLLLTGMLTAGAFGAGVLVAQPAGAPTAALLKRLAEAVDGHRTGARVYLVAELRPPHTVLGIYETEAAARGRVQGDSTTLGAFGPYQTERDPGALLGWFSKCVHLQSAMHENYCPGAPVLPLAEVDSVTLTVRLRNGTTRSIPVPRGADAIFFTLSAVDKFAIPYYTRVSGLEEAALLRRRLVNALLAP